LDGLKIRARVEDGRTYHGAELLSVVLVDAELGHLTRHRVHEVHVVRHAVHQAQPAPRQHRDKGTGDREVRRWVEVRKGLSFEASMSDRHREDEETRRALPGDVPEVLRKLGGQDHQVVLAHLQHPSTQGTTLAQPMVQASVCCLRRTIYPSSFAYSSHKQIS
jgi:hypothetical protein